MATTSGGPQSDSNYLKIVKFRKLWEVVDEAWLEDYLSDDDVDVPGEEVADDGEIDTGAIVDAAAKEEDKWADLALDRVVGDNPIR
mmetsp:Transcript_7970/g.26182  ORF Transcript_7970/g.26182 Transcript_7970/m.26182 type:complete len:86 (+) Transcript_7970:18-275(+)